MAITRHITLIQFTHSYCIEKLLIHSMKSLFLANGGLITLLCKNILYSNMSVTCHGQHRACCDDVTTFVLLPEYQHSFTCQSCILFSTNYIHVL